jgi:hypothetical protein
MQPVVREGSFERARPGSGVARCVRGQRAGHGYDDGDERAAFEVSSRASDARSRSVAGRRAGGSGPKGAADVTGDDADLEAMAEHLLLELHDGGHIQLVNRATAHSLAPDLSRMLDRMDPRTSRLADWLIEQKGINEVYASDEALAESLNRASTQLRARVPASAPMPLARDFEREGDRWVFAASVDLGWGAIDVRFVLDAEPTAADAERVAQIERLLLGSWATLWAPALRAHWADHSLLHDPALAAAAFEGIEVYLEPDHWSAQFTFDAPGLRTTGFFFELNGDRVVDTYAVD